MPKRREPDMRVSAANEAELIQKLQDKVARYGPRGLSIGVITVPYDYYDNEVEVGPKVLASGMQFPTDRVVLSDLQQRRQADVFPSLRAARQAYAERYNYRVDTLQIVWHDDEPPGWKELEIHE